MKPWRRIWTVFRAIDERPASRRQVFASLIIALVVMGAGFSVGLSKLSGETSENKRQAIEIAKANKLGAATRNAVDLVVCKRVAAAHGRMLINAVTLRRLLDVILAPAPDPTLSSRARQIRNEFVRARDQLRKSQVQIRRERDRDCEGIAQMRRGEEERLDEILNGSADPAPRPRLGPRTETETTTVPGPSSTRTVTAPSRTVTRTETVTRRELLPGVERTVPGPTVTLPAITETVTVTVPGPTQTVTTEVPVVFPPQTVTVTVPEPPPPPPTGTTTEGGTP